MLIKCLISNPNMRIIRGVIISLVKERRGWRRHFRLILSILQFFKPNHLMFCLNLHCSFPEPHAQLILLCCQINQKRFKRMEADKIKVIDLIDIWHPLSLVDSRVWSRNSSLLSSFLYLSISKSVFISER